MKKNTNSASLFLILITSLAMGGCQAIQDCFKKDDKQTDKALTCNSCEEEKCSTHDHSLKNDSSSSNSMESSSTLIENVSSDIACKLTSPELQKRKEVVLKSLREQMIDKHALPNGYSFKFSKEDSMLDELIEFIKTERQCCSFFTFNLIVNGDQNFSWMEITGGHGLKEFIDLELEL